MGFGSKKFWGSVAKIGIGFLPAGGAAMEAAKLGGELVVGELLMKDDDAKKLYRGWYKVGALLRDDDTLTNGERKTRLLERIDMDWKVFYAETPSETDLMLTFYTIVKDVQGGFEEEPTETIP